MRSLRANCVLAGAILIPPHPSIPPTKCNEGKGSSEKLRKLVAEKPFTMETRDDLQLPAI